MERVNIPAPQNFRVVEIGSDYIDLAWSPVAQSSLPITYKVLVKRAVDPEDAWTEFFNGYGTSCGCSNLQPLTEYRFKIFVVQNGITSTNSITCTAFTVKPSIILSPLSIRNALKPLTNAVSSYRWYSQSKLA